MRIIVSHPARQGNIYYRPRAAEQMGADVTFLTGLYYRPNQFPYWLVHFLPDDKKTRMRAQLEKRRLEGLSPENVVSLLGPLLEMTLRPLGKDREWQAIHDWLASKWLAWNLHQNDAGVLHVFQGACLHTLQTAGRFKNIVRIMEVTLPPAPGTPEWCTQGDDNMAGLRKEVYETDFILVQSEYSARCVTGLGASPERVIRYHLGVDTDHFHPRVSARRPGPLRFLFLGGTSQRKGIVHLIEAWTQVTRQLGSDVELILAGNRTQGIRELPAGLTNCRLLGRVSDEAFLALMQDADVLVHPSLAEGGCNVVYEALACGIPCIVSTNATSAVRDGVEGIVFPVGDVERLKCALLRMYMEPELRSRMREAARKRAVSLRWDKYLLNLAAIYRGLVQHAVTQSLEPVQALTALTF